MRLRGAKVWVRCDENHAPLPEGDGRVAVLYRQGGKLYRAYAKNLEPDDEPALLTDEEAAPQPEGGPEPAKGQRGPGKGGGRAQAHDGSAALPAAGSGDAIHVFTDGACFGNPGPMGIGVVILRNDADPKRQEISEYLGLGTNNIAELTAILRGLEKVEKGRPTVLYSDSAYAIGVVSQGWKAKANQDLVATIRRVAAQFAALRFVKVLGHSGVPENERCDELARLAIENARAAPAR